MHPNWCWITEVLDDTLVVRRTLRYCGTLSLTKFPLWFPVLSVFPKRSWSITCPSGAVRIPFSSKSCSAHHDGHIVSIAILSGCFLRYTIHVYIEQHWCEDRTLWDAFFSASCCIVHHSSIRWYCGLWASPLMNFTICQSRWCLEGSGLVCSVRWCRSQL